MTNTSIHFKKFHYILHIHIKFITYICIYMCVCIYSYLLSSSGVSTHLSSSYTALSLTLWLSTGCMKFSMMSWRSLSCFSKLSSCCDSSSLSLTLSSWHSAISDFTVWSLCCNCVHVCVWKRGEIIKYKKGEKRREEEEEEERKEMM